MWICWNLLGKTREITSSELIFGDLLAIWNHCVAWRWCWPRSFFQRAESAWSRRNLASPRHKTTQSSLPLLLNLEHCIDIGRRKENANIVHITCYLVLVPLLLLTVFTNFPGIRISLVKYYKVTFAGKVTHQQKNCQINITSGSNSYDGETR